MVTNGGAHPPDKWAEVTTETLLDFIQIPDEATSDAARSARIAKVNIKPVLFSILMAGHDHVQKHERGEIKKHGHKRLGQALDPLHHCEDPFSKVIATLTSTQSDIINEHFLKQEVQDVVRRTIGQHFATAMHIERSCHADKHNDTAEAKAFRKKYG